MLWFIVLSLLNLSFLVFLVARLYQINHPWFLRIYSLNDSFRLVGFQGQFLIGDYWIFLGLKIELIFCFVDQFGKHHYYFI